MNPPSSNFIKAFTLILTTYTVVSIIFIFTITPTELTNIAGNLSFLDITLALFSVIFQGVIISFTWLIFIGYPVSKTIMKATNSNVAICGSAIMLTLLFGFLLATLKTLIFGGLINEGISNLYIFTLAFFVGIAGALGLINTPNL